MTPDLQSIKGFETIDPPTTELGVNLVTEARLITEESDRHLEKANFHPK